MKGREHLLQGNAEGPEAPQQRRRDRKYPQRVLREGTSLCSGAQHRDKRDREEPTPGQVHPNIRKNFAGSIGTKAGVMSPSPAYSRTLLG